MYNLDQYSLDELKVIDSIFSGRDNIIIKGGCSNMIKALTPMYEGQYCKVEVDGKIYKRVVRYRRDVGLYIVINNIEYYEYEFNYDEYYKQKEGN